MNFNNNCKRSTPLCARCKGVVPSTNMRVTIIKLCGWHLQEFTLESEPQRAKFCDCPLRYTPSFKDVVTVASCCH